MVRAVRAGMSYRLAARRWRVAVSTVALWVQRAQGKSLAKVHWADRSRRPRRNPQRTPAMVLRSIRRARAYLKDRDALGEYGAEAIRRWLLAQSLPAPSGRSIARWLAKWGLSGRERWRRPAPPKGWYLPEVAAGRAELDSADVVEGLRLAGRGRIEVLNIHGLWDGLADSYPAERIGSHEVREALERRWRERGCPSYVQFDNDTIFSGAHAQRDYFGRLVHWCHCLGIVPVFTPPASLGFQGMIEAYNRRWQDRVWRRWHHRNLVDLRQRSAAFVLAYAHRQREQRGETGPVRTAWQEPRSDPAALPIVALRRLDEVGGLTLCAQRLRIARSWAGRLVRCEISVSKQSVTLFGLRRADPDYQPKLACRRLKVRLVPWHTLPTAQLPLTR